MPPSAAASPRLPFGRRPRSVGALVALLGLCTLAACGAAPVGRGSSGASDASHTSGRPGGAGGSGQAASAGDAGRGVAGAAAVGGSTGAGGPAASAEAAMTSYLRAVAQHDASALAGNADKAALAVAAVLLDSASINRDRGATTTVTTGPSSFVPVASSPTSVTLDGSVTISTSVSGSEGSDRFTDTISGPVAVDDDAGTWKVSGFSYDGQPVQYWPQTAEETVGGTHLSVGYVVSYGNLTAVLATLTQASGSTEVQLERCTLSTAAGAVSGTGDFTTPPTPTGVLRFSRVPSPPRTLELDFTSGGHAVDFVLSLS